MSQRSATSWWSRLIHALALKAKRCFGHIYNSTNRHESWFHQGICERYSTANLNCCALLRFSFSATSVFGVLIFRVRVQIDMQERVESFVRSRTCCHSKEQKPHTVDDRSKLIGCYHIRDPFSFLSSWPNYWLCWWMVKFFVCCGRWLWDLDWM